jgi:2,3-bisphosphoglycerate-independent phosphoglycerate mutase
VLASASVDWERLVQPASTKILLVVVDGLGGYADELHGTELEEARTPNLDRLAAEGVTGLLEPVAPGVTPGSGPGHLALFGLDPQRFELGRGVLSAAGLEFELEPGDVAARGNLCTLGTDGTVVDRRAGRIGDEEARSLIDRLQESVRLAGVRAFFQHEREHRLLLVLRGEGLDPRVSDTDPQKTGVPPTDPRPLDQAAARTAAVVDELMTQARDLLADQPKANGLLLRGFDTLRRLPSFADRYGLRAGASAIYPMYRGIARLLGMAVLGRPAGLGEQVAAVGEAWNAHDFLFLHHKDADSAGEDGDRARKIAAIEALDGAIPSLQDLGPDVLVVTGDHSTPSQMAGHSWHAVPLVLWSVRCGRDEVDRFGERWCIRGGLGIRRSLELMPLTLANAGRLQKYGA